jgi:RHS repeat-associated protein
VTKRYYAQGVQDGGANYYYARDHLGSIREVVNSTGTVVARYDYDPYGRRTKIAGSYIADFGYTGWYFHPAEDGAAGGLQLALYRAYSPDLGRWLNRDPIGEAGGINLYTFVDNDSIDEVDPDGLYGNPIPGIINFNTGTGAGDVGRVGLFPNPSPTGAAVLNTGLSFVPFGNVSVGGAEIISDPKNPLGYASLIPGEKTAIELHHLLPQSKRLAPFFKRAGLNIEDFKLPLDKAKHRLRPNGIHTGPSEESWNGTWESFFKANPGATKQAILDQLAKMRNDFGI